MQIHGLKSYMMLKYIYQTILLQEESGDIWVGGTSIKIIKEENVIEEVSNSNG